MNPIHSNIIKALLLFFVLILVNVFSFYFFERFDLTEDNRYTLSPAAKEIISDVKKPLIIEVFLEGEFPAEFRKLQFETRQLLEEFSAYNPNIKFNFNNPLQEGKNANAVATRFYEMGMIPARINVVENGRSSETIIFPWAVARYGDKSEPVQLLKNKLGATSEERITASVQQLQYAFADAISKLVQPKRKKIAVMRGNGELPDARIADFVRSLQEYYFTAAFTLDSVAGNPQETLENLKKYDLIIEPKPIQAFSEKEKYVLDQYLMNGGKMVWMVDPVAMETDSLFSSDAAYALSRDLNLDDFFFKYGIRLNPVLVKDLYSAPIVLATGSGKATSFDPYPWLYYPLAASPNNHPINNNIGTVKFEYASTIDTLKNQIEKTILLHSSEVSKLEGVPTQISLNDLSQKPNFSTFEAEEEALAVLLEGKFTSVYKNRIKPFEIPHPIEEGKASKIIVIADGDIVKNQLQKGRPLELGFDRYTGETYANKEFLINSVNYMLDDNGLIKLRSKKIDIAFLDLQKVEKNRNFWQVINLLVPIVLLGIFGVLFVFFRKKKNIR